MLNGDFVVAITGRPEIRIFLRANAGLSRDYGGFGGNNKRAGFCVCGRAGVV